MSELFCLMNRVALCQYCKMGFFGCREIAGGLESNCQQAETLQARVRVLVIKCWGWTGQGSGMPAGEAATHPWCDLECKENRSCCEQSVVFDAFSLSHSVLYNS